MKKQCSKCKTYQKSERFYRHPNTKDGLMSWCKECQNELAVQIRKKKLELNPIKLKRGRKSKTELESVITASIEITPTASVEVTSSIVEASTDERRVLFYITGSVTGSIEYNMPVLRKNAAASRMYWSPETSAAIVAFNSSTCDTNRNVIFETYIHKPMCKLVENVFNTFKFSYFDNGPEQAQQECLTHVVANIGKFDPHKRNRVGNLVNSFSYFSIIAKNYLIMTNNAHYKRQSRVESLDCSYGEGGDDHYTAKVPDALIEEENAPYQYSSVDIINFIIDYFEQRMSFIFKHRRDVTIANSVIEILRNHERIDTFNKKALYLYLREMCRYKTQQITKVINRMEKYVQAIVRQYNNTGQVNMEDIVVETIQSNDSLPTSETDTRKQINVGTKRRITVKSEFFRRCKNCKYIQYYATAGSYRTALNRKSKCIKCQKPAA